MDLLFVDTEDVLPSSSPFTLALSDLALSSDRLITLLVDPDLPCVRVDDDLFEASFLDDGIIVVLPSFVLLPSLCFSPSSEELDRAAVAVAVLERLDHPL